MAHYQILISSVHGNIGKIHIETINSINLARTIWITWWVILFIRYSRSLGLYQKKKKNLEKNNGSYSLSDNQDCFEYINKNLEKAIANLLILICISKTENRITFKIRLRSCFEFLTLLTMKISLKKR